PAEDEKAPGVKLVVGHRDAIGGAGASQADEMLGADVRGEDRGPDDEPAEAVGRQEKILRGVVLLEDEPPGKTEKESEIAGDDDPIERFHAGIPARRDRRSELDKAKRATAVAE